MKAELLEKFVALLKEGHTKMVGPFWCYHEYGWDEARGEFVITDFCEQPPEEKLYLKDKNELGAYIRDMGDEELAEELVDKHENPDKKTGVIGCGKCVPKGAMNLAEWTELAKKYKK